MPTSQNLIDRLNGAEELADKIIEEAKRYRKALLSRAREAAQEELKVFSARQESAYQAAVGSKKDDHAAKDLEVLTSAQLNLVESDFVKNKERTVGYVVDKVLDVTLTLTSTQKQALISEGPAGPAGAPRVPAIVRREDTLTFDVFTPHARKESLRTFDMATPSSGIRRSSETLSTGDSWIGQEGCEPAFDMEAIAEDNGVDDLPAGERAADTANGPSAEPAAAEHAAEPAADRATEPAATAKRGKKKGSKA